MKVSKDSDLFRLRHIHDCIEKITTLVATCENVEVFTNNWIVQDAMIRNFEIIGEASNHVSDFTKKRYTEIEWHKLRGLRNFVSHEYFGVKISTIWETATKSIPLLKRDIDKIIADLEPS